MLRIAGLERKAIQYDIGNPLIATRMTRHAISAALYAPIRVLLSADADGHAVIEYDSPASTFGQLHDPDVDPVARALDARLRSPHRRGVSPTGPIWATRPDVPRTGKT